MSKQPVNCEIELEFDLQMPFESWSVTFLLYIMLSYFLYQMITSKVVVGSIQWCIVHVEQQNNLIFETNWYV